MEEKDRKRKRSKDNGKKRKSGDSEHLTFTHMEREAQDLKHGTLKRKSRQRQNNEMKAQSERGEIQADPGGVQPRVLTSCPAGRQSSSWSCR